MRRVFILQKRQSINSGKERFSTISTSEYVIYVGKYPPSSFFLTSNLQAKK